MKLVIKTDEIEKKKYMLWLILFFTVQQDSVKTGNSEFDRWNMQLDLYIMQGDTHGRGRRKVDMSTKKGMTVRLSRMLW